MWVPPELMEYDVERNLMKRELKVQAERVEQQDVEPQESHEERIERFNLACWYLGKCQF